MSGEFVKLDKDNFDLLRKQIYRMCGLTISEGKGYLIEHRFKPLYQARNCRSWRDFYQLLLSGDVQFKEDAISAISTHETSFFRDNHPFVSIRNKILPELLKNRKAGAKIRIWCAASSTGQEPYSLSMLIHEWVRSLPGVKIRPSDFSILATDISGAVIERAQEGLFTNHEKSRGLPAGYDKYFEKSEGRWKVSPSVKSIVSFKKFNLLNSFRPLGQFDFVMCRNVLIYFDDATKVDIVHRIHDMLPDKGFLMLGSTETLAGHTDRFATEHMGAVLLYRKVRWTK
ncbi:protein-glutamate O-methyltransferase CheR [Maridesulfovibrio sp.]|uniref:CheR family methyltransferase n=1 Tax=Maridesulfovibrio sp. TaxID=2795000 RepID=UPI0029C9FA9A|nr:protein-glutamate O-methyltransferase CheR [Maridesulfovibrio sp.]